jgi:hypothetical protein
VDSVVDTDRPCIRCGYSLRGLHAEMLCPECGLTVGESLKGDLLRHCDPGYLAQLARGVRWVLLSVIATIVGGIGLLALMIALDLTGGHWLDFGLRLYGGGCVTAFGLGWWWLTERDQGRLGEDAGERVRRLARGGVVALVVMCWGGLTVNWIGNAVPKVVSEGLHVLTLAAFGGSQVAGMRYLMRLGDRAPDAALVKKARSAAKWLGVITVIGLGLWVMERSGGRGWRWSRGVINLGTLIVLFNAVEVFVVVRDVVKKSRRAQAVTAVVEG